MKKEEINKYMNERYHSSDEIKQKQIEATKNWIKNNRFSYNSYQNYYKKDPKNAERVAIWAANRKMNQELKIEMDYFSNLNYVTEDKLLCIFRSGSSGNIKLMQMKNISNEEFTKKIKYLSSENGDLFSYDEVLGVFLLKGDFKLGLKYLKNKNKQYKLTTSTFSDFNMDLLNKISLLDVEKILSINN